MRELIGKIPTKDSNISEKVYLSEMIRCLECQQTVPIGIEVVTVKKVESPRRFSGTCATAADMVLIMKRRRRVCRSVPTLNRKHRCSVSIIRPGALLEIVGTQTGVPGGHQILKPSCLLFLKPSCLLLARNGLPGLMDSNAVPPKHVRHFRLVIDW